MACSSRLATRRSRPDLRIVLFLLALPALCGRAIWGDAVRRQRGAGAEKKSAAKLADARTARKIVRLDGRTVLAFSGLTADARVLVDKARVEAQSFQLTYDEPPTVEYLAKFIAQARRRRRPCHWAAPARFPLTFRLWRSFQPRRLKPPAPGIPCPTCLPLASSSPHKDTVQEMEETGRVFFKWLVGTLPFMRFRHCAHLC